MRPGERHNWEIECDPLIYPRFTCSQFCIYSTIKNQKQKNFFIAKFEYLTSDPLQMVTGGDKIFDTIALIYRLCEIITHSE